MIFFYGFPLCGICDIFNICKKYFLSDSFYASFCVVFNIKFDIQSN